MNLQINFGFGVGRDKDGLGILPSDREVGLNFIRQRAAHLFGGYTLYETTGGWTNGAGRLVEEEGRTLMVLTTDEQYTLDQKIDQMAEAIKFYLNQDAVAVTQTAVQWEMK